MDLCETREIIGRINFRTISLLKDRMELALQAKRLKRHEVFRSITEESGS